MGIFSGCLLASDIDGTLMCNATKVIPSRNLEAIKYFISEGGFFTLATGRMARYSKECYDICGANAPIIANQGSSIYDYKTKSYVLNLDVTSEFKEILEEIRKRFPKVGIEIFSNDKCYKLQDHICTMYHAGYLKFEFSDVPSDYKKLKWDKVVFLTDNDKELSALKEYLLDVPQNICSVYCSLNLENFKLIEVGNPNANKGYALNKLKEFLGAKKTFAIGDFYNDVQLLEQADVSAVPAESPEELKKMANYVAGRCESGAVADFIEQISLEMKGRNLWKN